MLTGFQVSIKILNTSQAEATFGVKSLAYDSSFSVYSRETEGKILRANLCNIIYLFFFLLTDLFLLFFIIFIFFTFSPPWSKKESKSEEKSEAEIANAQWCNR